MNETAIQKQGDACMIRRETRTYVPNADIIEQNDAFLLMVDLPGARRESIDVSFERGSLTLRAEAPPRGGSDWQMREYGVGDFERSFELGEAIDAERIEANYRDGVLTIRLPKQERVVARKIEVRAD